MIDTVNEQIADFLAEHPNATMRETSEHGISIASRMIEDGKPQEGADFIHAWTTKFSEVFRARITATPQKPAISVPAAAQPSMYGLSGRVSSGKLTALVAGIGLAAAGFYMFTRETKREPAATRGNWAEYVEQRRAVISPGTPLPPR